MKSGQGARATVRYTVRAQLHAGGTLCLGDGIKGRPLADQVLNLIREAGRFSDPARAPSRHQERTQAGPEQQQTAAFAFDFLGLFTR